MKSFFFMASGKSLSTFSLSTLEDMLVSGLNKRTKVDEKAKCLVHGLELILGSKLARRVADADRLINEELGHVVRLACCKSNE